MVCIIGYSGQGVGDAMIALVEAALGPIKFGIDIKPGSDPNSINCKNRKGKIPVTTEFRHNPVSRY